MGRELINKKRGEKGKRKNLKLDIDKGDKFWYNVVEIKSKYNTICN